MRVLVLFLLLLCIGCTEDKLAGTITNIYQETDGTVYITINYSASRYIYARQALEIHIGDIVEWNRCVPYDYNKGIVTIIKKAN